MTALLRPAKSSLPAGGSVFAAFALLLLAVWPRAWAADAPAAGTPEEAALKRDFQSCHEHANVDACYDAIRWNPSDPALLVALGDALERARHPAEAIRAYRRAAALAPNMPGIAEKISAVEAKQSSKRAPRNGSAHGASNHGGSGKRYSNAAPETQSH
jgi:cytochrome c-type biogenesis protein CcmH/NrfG